MKKRFFSVILAIAMTIAMVTTTAHATPVDDVKVVLDPSSILVGTLKVRTSTVDQYYPGAAGSSFIGTIQNIGNVDTLVQIKFQAIVTINRDTRGRLLRQVGGIWNDINGNPVPHHMEGGVTIYDQDVRGNSPPADKLNPKIIIDPRGANGEKLIDISLNEEGGAPYIDSSGVLKETYKPGIWVDASSSPSSICKWGVGADGYTYLWLENCYDIIYYACNVAMSINMGNEFQAADISIVDCLVGQCKPNSAIPSAINWSYYTGSVIDQPLGDPPNAATTPTYDACDYVALPGYVFDDLKGTVENLSDKPAKVTIKIIPQVQIRSDSSGNPLDISAYPPVSTITSVDNIIINVAIDTSSGYWSVNADGSVFGVITADMAANEIRDFTYSIEFDENMPRDYVNALITFKVVTEWEESVAKTFTVTWLNYDNSVLDTEDYLIGEFPEYKGSTPTSLLSDAEFTYVFAGWTPSIATVTSAATYTSVFEPVKNKYTVEWVRNGEVIGSQLYEYGAYPVFGTPTSVWDNDEFTYVFTGWSPNIATVTGAATYTSVFEPVKKTYTIIWQNDDGTQLESQTLEYGAVPAYSGSTPTSVLDPLNSFVGWLPAIIPVEGPATYMATYASIPQYTVIWKNWDGTVLKTELVNKGDSATPPSPLPTNPPAVFKAWTGGDYTCVTEDMTLIASFKDKPATDITIMLNGVKIIAVVTGSRNSTYTFDVIVGEDETAAYIAWTSSDTSVATINASTGVVTTKTKLGSTTITARDTISGASYSFVLRVL